MNSFFLYRPLLGGAFVFSQRHNHKYTLYYPVKKSKDGWSLLFCDSLHAFVNGARDYVVLLLFGEFDKVHGVTRNANGKLRIFFGMGLCIQQRIAVEYIHV